MLSYLLDTHIYIWWRVGSSQLSREQARVLDHTEAKGESLGLSAISIWEMAMLASRNRIELHNIPLHMWLKQVENDPGIEILPLSADVCVESVSLPSGFHRDPADQQIVATARFQGFGQL